MQTLHLIGRSQPLLLKDIEEYKDKLSEVVFSSTFLVIGGAGSIGSAVVKEIFERKPKKLHVVDISENNLVELVRDIRSSYGYIDGDFRTFAIDCGSVEFDLMFTNEGPYDYILNLSALKHVRSEKDPYTLMRMIEINILNTIKTIDMAIQTGSKKYFCVSTDKAANPANMMGASKRIMEMFLAEKGNKISISTARFANVAFSDGSLLHGFNQRLIKKQPIVAPNDVRIYFVVSKEDGQLCLISTILGNNGDIIFPKLEEELNLITFSQIAENYLVSRGLKVHYCKNEEEARSKIHTLDLSIEWPCLFSQSDTTGEKDYEEFFTEGEQVDFTRFQTLGIVKNTSSVNTAVLNEFLLEINSMRDHKTWNREQIVKLFFKMITDLNYKDTGKYLDGKM